jgi:septal ring factor EnvC (AmiA/AmiB activator)
MFVLRQPRHRLEARTWTAIRDGRALGLGDATTRARARDGPYAKILLQRMMDAVGELEKRREELAELRSGLERERERAQNERARAVVERERVEDEQALSEQLHSQIAEMRVRLDHSTDELRRTSEALHLLRSSHLMRSTATARRLYYRVTGKA